MLVSSLMLIAYVLLRPHYEYGLMFAHLRLGFVLMGIQSKAVIKAKL